MTVLNALLLSRKYICKTHVVKERRPNEPYESGFIGPIVINSNFEMNNPSNTVLVLSFHARKILNQVFGETRATATFSNTHHVLFIFKA